MNGSGAQQHATYDLCDELLFDVVRALLRYVRIPRRGLQFALQTLSLVDVSSVLLPEMVHRGTKLANGSTLRAHFLPQRSNFVVVTSSFLIDSWMVSCSLSPCKLVRAHRMHAWDGRTAKLLLPTCAQILDLASSSAWCLRAASSAAIAESFAACAAAAAADARPSLLASATSPAACITFETHQSTIPNVCRCCDRNQGTIGSDLLCHLLEGRTQAAETHTGTHARTYARTHAHAHSYLSFQHLVHLGHDDKFATEVLRSAPASCKRILEANDICGASCVCACTTHRFAGHVLAAFSFEDSYALPQQVQFTQEP